MVIRFRRLDFYDGMIHADVAYYKVGNIYLEKLTSHSRPTKIRSIRLIRVPSYLRVYLEKFNSQ